MTVSRREAIKRAALLFGSTLFLPDVLKAWESPEILNKSIRFTADQSALIAEIAELIVPTTSTPGAKAAGVPAFIEKMIADCHTKKDQEIFFDAIMNPPKPNNSLKNAALRFDKILANK